jgi:addiction module HigA family antidote
MPRKLPPLHPGEVLREELLKPMSLSAGAVAWACSVPRTRIERIAEEKIGITADTALRLGRLFKTTPEFWLNLQKDCDLQVAHKAAGRKIEKIEPLGPEEAALSA